MHIITYTNEAGAKRRLTFGADQLIAVISLTARLTDQGINYHHIFED